MYTFLSNENILKVLYSYNPWWSTNFVNEVFNKKTKRFSFFDANNSFMHESIRRHVLLSGARRTGKTTIMYQTIAKLLDYGIEDYDGKLIYRIPAYAFLYLLGLVEFNKDKN